MTNKYSAEYLLNKGSFSCPCGKFHTAHLKKYVCRSGALKCLPDCIRVLNGSKAFIIEDKNTYIAAGEQAEQILGKGGIPFVKKLLEGEHLEPDENTLGSAVLCFDYSCDIIVGVGSGVINDICKIIAGLTNLPFIIVATAPSMDGYASSTSAVIRDGLKVSLPSKCPDCVLADLDIVAAAPYKMICAGLGDMLAKYISICEWRIGSIVTGEYYCEEVASIIRSALKKCVDNYKGLKSRDPEAISNIMEGLVLSGIAADYAGVSRPVSGVEHYISHIWDMRSIEFSAPYDLHGIQCGISTLCALDYYSKLKEYAPDIEYAKNKFRKFSIDAWTEKLRTFLGSASDKMIEAFPWRELYNPGMFVERIEKICLNYDDIMKIINEELPDAGSTRDILGYLECPSVPSDIFPQGCDMPLTLKATKDIRDKYVLSALLFDMGIIDEF